MKRPPAVPKTFKLKKLFGVPFRNAHWLASAMIHPSYRNEHSCRPLEHFDRMEFFGDSILNFVICRELYGKYPKADEGLLSRLRSILVSRKVLSRIARKLQLGRYLVVGRSLRNQVAVSKHKIYADCLESFIAAVFLDRGLGAAEKFIKINFEPFIDAKKLFRLDPNPKSTLQELSQKHWQQIPAYRHTGLSANRTKATVEISKKLRAQAQGRNRQEAEEKAARMLIQKIRQMLLLRSKSASSGKKVRRIF